MAKKSDRLSAFEEELVGYYADDYVEAARLSEDRSLDELEKLVLKSRYGDEYRSSMPAVNWGEFFDKHACPVCGDLVSLQEKRYSCGKCGFKVPIDLYDRALAIFRKEDERARKAREFSRKTGESGLAREKVRELYDMGVELAGKRLSEGSKTK